MAMQIKTSTFPELDAKICVGVLFNQKIMNNEYVIVDSNLISQIRTDIEFKIAPITKVVSFPSDTTVELQLCTVAPKAPEPPPHRLYIKYPKAVTLTNISVVVDRHYVNSLGFLFAKGAYDAGAITVGPSFHNSFLLYGKQQYSSNPLKTIGIIEVAVSDVPTLPKSPAYSRFVYNQCGKIRLVLVKRLQGRGQSRKWCQTFCKALRHRDNTFPLSMFGPTHHDDW